MLKIIYIPDLHPAFICHAADQFLFSFAGCEQTQTNTDEQEPVSVSDFKLNTVVDIKIYDSRDRSLLDDCFSLCDRYELVFSRTNEDSELYRLNHREDQGQESGSFPYKISTDPDSQKETWMISPSLQIFWMKDLPLPGNPEVLLILPLRLLPLCGILPQKIPRYRQTMISRQHCHCAALMA